MRQAFDAAAVARTREDCATFDSSHRLAYMLVPSFKFRSHIQASAACEDGFRAAGHGAGLCLWSFSGEFRASDAACYELVGSVMGDVRGDPKSKAAAVSAGVAMKMWMEHSSLIFADSLVYYLPRAKSHSFRNFAL